MHDPRTSPALRTLAPLTGDPPAPRWTWSICRLDTAGRLCVPAAGVTALGPGPWSMRWHRLAVVLEADAEAVGQAVSIDGRRRLLVPVWLRQQGRHVLVGTDAVHARVLVAPIGVLDGLGDVLAGDQR
jgi:hypothetical protein